MRGEQLKLPGVAMGKRKLCRLCEAERLVLNAAVDEHMHKHPTRRWKNVPALVAEIKLLLSGYCEVYRVPVFDITEFNMKTVLETLDVKYRPTGELLSDRVTSIMRRRARKAKKNAVKVQSVLAADPALREEIRQLVRAELKEELQRQRAGNG